ncbi:hypothetical protein [Rickettsia endosymbiont of Polydrusus tereticollis]|uniref:hypothetical protein n=1 Tax=Rickettsia endosymbiont of Polydrusus tereticollis TaxID=3066251 RepID=UPI003132DD45
MWNAEQWEQHREGEREKAKIYAADEHHRKQRNKSSSDSGDGELLGALIVFGGIAAYKGAKFLGKAAIEGGKVAIEGGKIAGKTAANAYKLHKGDIEIVSKDNEGNIIEKAPEPASIEPQENSTFSKREKVKEWIGKGIKRSKSASELMTSAYKLTTSTTEIVSTDEEGKQKVIITTPKPTIQYISSKMSPLIYEKQTYGEVREDIINIINVPLKYKFDNKIIEVTAYRYLTFTDTINPGSSFLLKFALSNRIDERTDINKACFEINYDANGKLQKLALPNPPALCHNPNYPVLISYHNNLYIVPVNSGHYQHLTQKIHENNGVVEIGHADSAYHIEAIYD